MSTRKAVAPHRSKGSEECWYCASLLERLDKSICSGASPTGLLLIVDEDDSFLSGLVAGAYSSGELGELITVEKTTLKEGAERINEGEASAMLILPDGAGSSGGAFDQDFFKREFKDGDVPRCDLLKEGPVVPGRSANGLTGIVDQNIDPGRREFVFEEPRKGLQTGHVA